MKKDEIRQDPVKDKILEGINYLDGNRNNPLSTCDKYFKFVKQYLD